MVFEWVMGNFFPMMVMGLFAVFWLSFGMLQLVGLSDSAEEGEKAHTWEADPPARRAVRDGRRSDRFHLSPIQRRHRSISACLGICPLHLLHLHLQDQLRLRRHLPACQHRFVGAFGSLLEGLGGRL